MNDLEYHLYEEAKAGRLTRQQLLVRASVLGISVPALAAILSACGGGSSSSTPAGSSSGGNVKTGGTGIFGITSPAQDVDPVTMFNTGSIMTTQLACDYLVFPAEDYALQPRLATKWESATVPDEWTFTIRQGVTWHDGTPFTVDDVVASFDRITDPEIGSAALSAFAGVLSKGNVEKVGEETVKFHLDRPYGDFPYLLSSFNYNAVILPKNYEIGTFTKGGIGTGPFILKTFSVDQGVTYEKNPNYWGDGLPYLDAAEIKYFADTPPIVLALQGGSIHVFPQVPYQGSQALFADSNIKVTETSSSEYRTLQMRVDMEPFSSKEARQAVAYSLDRPGLVEGLLGGKAEVGNDHAFAPIYPGSPTTDDVPQRTQDIEKAKQLLADAGLTDLQVTLTTEQFLEIPQYAQFIKEMCAPAGINVNLDVQPQTKFYGTGANQPWLQVPFGITDWGARGTAGQTIDPAYLCRSVPAPDLSNAGAWNSAHWCNEEFDHLVEAFEAEVDEQKRKELAVQAATIQQDEVPDVIAYWIRELRATRTNVNGIAPGPTFHLDAREMWLA
ncbi:MAG: peptide/nickel transport system substrate-binding protein [Gaiellales bacterium]|nr:peptide/nickel transport system substrate-binding protein [Gaiellales bacterium]